MALYVSHDAAEAIEALVDAQRLGEKFSEDDSAKVLDYFADTTRFERNFHPWPG